MLMRCVLRGGDVQGVGCGGGKDLKAADIFVESAREVRTLCLKTPRIDSLLDASCGAPRTHRSACQGKAAPRMCSCLSCEGIVLVVLL
jgi:hypothetical protein